MDIPLDGYKVLEIAKSDKQTKMLTYDQLTSLTNKDIDKLLETTNILLFYPTISDELGHWTALFKRSKNTYEFYDPYGYFPNDVKTVYKLNPRLLLYLYHLIKKNKTVEFNHHKHQSKGENIATCGRHTGLRLKNYKTPLEDYHKTMKKIASGLDISLDQLVTYMTNFI